jgi:hypothetical protein
MTSCRRSKKIEEGRSDLPLVIEGSSRGDRGWRATLYTTGMEHSPTSATGTGWEHALARDAAGGVATTLDLGPIVPAASLAAVSLPALALHLKGGSRCV